MADEEISDMKWTETFKVNSHFTDADGIVRVSSLLRYMQETANLQMLALGPSNSQLREMGYAFVLSRLSMSFYKPVFAYETIEVQSWACESKGSSFNRCYRILREGMIVAEASSVWALLRISDRRLMRVGDVTLNFEPDPALELDMPRRLKIPDGAVLVLVGERNAVYSDLDFNRHINNTNYPDLLCDFLPDMSGKRIISMGISFLSEALLGETLKVYCAEYDGTYYMRTVKESGAVNVEAEILLESI